MKPYLNFILSGIRLIALLLICSLTAYAQPISNFNATPVAGCSPLIVSFQDLSTGNPTSWLWNFGNGNTSTLQNPSATYFTPGTYTIMLTATNAAGSNTFTRTQYITVYEPPVVNFSGDISSGCFPLRVQFTDLSTAGQGNTNVSWEWSFGNGQTSTLQNPLVTYNTAGIFTVTLKVTNDKGCSRTISRSNYITVTTGVRSAFTNTRATVCSAPATINFTNTSTGPPTLSYLWDFGDGNTSTLQNPSHIYTNNGSYIATLVTFSTAGCQDTLRSNPIVIGGITTDFNYPASICVNETATFTNASTPVPVRGSWKFGDGATAPTINSAHVYTNPGTYNVTLYNTYSNCVDSITHQIAINPRPVADFSAPVTAKCEPPLTVNFQNLSTGSVNWEWDFGDGNTSTAQNPVHTYTSYGNFTVTLIATNGFGCTDTIIKPDFITVQRAAISINYLPVRGCVPYTISPQPVINSVDAITSYQWDFGNGATSSLQNPIYTYTSQGTYTVSLIITTSSGCSDTLIIPAAVTVGDKPVTNFSATPIPVCSRQPVQFTDLSAPSDQWVWEFGDGVISTLQNPIHSYSDTGYFTITLIAYNNGCPDTIVKTNYVQVLPPIARFAITPDCINRLQFSFTDQSIAPQTWEWDFGDGSPHVFIQNPTHIFPALGSYNVELIVTNGGCADTLSQLINAVNESPDFVANITTACKGLAAIDFYALNVTPTNVINYFWDFGDGTTINTILPTLTHTYINSGTYTVALTITDINGCTNTITKPSYIRINGPSAAFTATNTAGCIGLTTTFNDFSVDDGLHSITNWQWNFGDGVIQNYSASPFSHAYSTVGTFSVQLIVTDAVGCMDSILIPNLVIATDPTPNFSAPTLTCPGATVAFTNTSSPSGLSHTWDFGDGNSSTAVSPTHSYASIGSYTIKLFVQDAVGCTDSLIRQSYLQVGLPVANFTISDSVTSCIPLEVQFTNTSTFYSSVVWDFGAGQGNAAINNPIHYYSTPGIYLVKLVTTSPGGCKDSLTKTITIYDTAGSRFNYSPIRGCKPLSIAMNTLTPGPMVSYYWDFGDGYNQTTVVPSADHLYASYGNYLPKVIMEDPSGCRIPLQGIDTIFISGANAKFGYDASFFCDYGAVHFSDSTTFNDPIANYYWSFGDGNTSNQQSPSHLYTTPGIFDVQLIVETQLGCRDTLTKPAIIKLVLRPLIDIGGDSIICINNSITHEGIFLRTDTSFVNWQWSFPNGNSSTFQNPLPQTYTTAGTFIATAIATNSSGCKDTTQQTIIVNPLPTVSMPGLITIQAGFPVTIPAIYSPNTVNWIWSPSAGLSCNNCPNPEAGPKFNTTYQVFFTDENNCSNIGTIQFIVQCKDGNLFIPNTFSPNGDGSNDVFYPRGKGLERVKLLRIFNRWGEVVFEKRDFPVNDAAAGWNGTFKGQRPKADVYIYQAEVFCDNGDIIRLNGNIALIL